MSRDSALVEFPDLSRQAFQHDWDLQAANALKQVPGLPRVIRFLSENFMEQFMKFENVSSNLCVNAQQYPSLHRQFVKMAQVLDVRKLPALFIKTTPTVNAFAMGIENYSIVLCSGLVDIMEEGELMAILGHELGHVKCEHQLFKTMAHLIVTFGDAFFSQATIPGLDLVLNAGRVGLELALMDWNRKAELSCDRAALLATQEPDVVASALAKLAGFSRRYGGELSLDEAEHQCEAYEDLGTDSLMMKLLKLRAMMAQTHPFPVVRVRQIRSWARSDEYRKILAGKYRRNAAARAGDGRWAGVKVESARTRECPRCQCPCADDYTFCPACQTNIRAAPLLCTKCRQPVEPDWSACMACGSWLEASSP